MEETRTYTFTCSRPRLASILMQSGYSGQQTVNPWKPDLLVWVFEIDGNGAEIVKDYYKRIGKKPPYCIERILAKGAAV